MAKWCKFYNCWCSDAEDITYGDGGCDYDCKNCDGWEEVN